MPDIPPKLQNQIAQYQQVQQQLQMIMAQRNQYSLQLEEVERALEELGKSKPETPIYRNVGSLLIKVEKQEDLKKELDEMKDTLGKIVRNSKILESRDLADKIQKYLVKSLSGHYSGVEDLGVRGGPFWVLIGGEMPSVLVEISHLSNSVEEERLGSPAYRKQVAQGIHDGISEYIRSLGKG